MNKFNASIVQEKGKKVFDEYERLWYWLERKELVGIFWDKEKQKEILKTIENFILWKFDEYKEKELLTALVLCTNHKIWYWYDKETQWSEKLATMYDKIWKRIHWKMSKKLKWEDLSRYYRAVD